MLDLFSGIGGFSLGLERAGMKTVAFCEIDPFCRQRLRRHWPDVPIYEDVRDLTADTLSRDGIAIDAIAGGFPCQDISAAGRKAGITADRSGLWGEYARLIGELRPGVAIVENVTALLSGPSERPGEWFGVVLRDLAALGYDALWDCIPAAAVGAPHVRDRVWIVAYPSRERRNADRKAGNVSRASKRPHGALRHVACEPSAATANMAHTDGQSLERSAVARQERNPWQIEPDFCRVVDGLSDELDDERRACISALGNSVIPDIPELIGRAILRAAVLSKPGAPQ